MNRFLMALALFCWLPTSPVFAADFPWMSGERWFLPGLFDDQKDSQAADSDELSAAGQIYEFQPEFEAVIRGQTPQTYDLGSPQWQPGPTGADPYFGGAQPGAIPQGAYPGMPPQQGGVYSSPYGASPMPQPGYDPFNTPMQGGYMQPQQQPGVMYYGINGPQPARLGWTHRWDLSYVLPSSTRAGGKVDAFSVDWAADYVTQGAGGWLWTLTPEVNYRNFDFKNSVPLAAANIADNYYRFAHRFEATTPPQGPASVKLGFTPAIATDFHHSLNSNGLNLDADATLYLRSSQQWMWVAGVLYWDRAKDYILPHAGAVWNPNQFLEIRAVFPNPRMDYFLGTPMGIATWAYLGAEYDIESYQADKLVAARGQVQMAEWRAFTGLRWETCRISSYFDVGYAFDRRWRIQSSAGAADISPSDAFMMRLGFRY